MSSRTTSGQNIPKITASTAAGIHPKANPKKPYVSVQNPHTPTNVAAAVIQVPTSYQSRMSATLVTAHPVLNFPRCDIFFRQFVARQIRSPGYFFVLRFVWADRSVRTARYRRLVADLVKATSHHVAQARRQLQFLLGDRITLFPTNTGIPEAEIRGDYAGLVYATVPHEISLVGRAGVEPATNGLKVRCSTT